MKRLTTIWRTCLLTSAGSLCLAPTPVAAQTTQADLRTQAKNVDFSNAAATKPFKTGTILPSSCAVSDTFFNPASAPGQNLFICTAVNTWTLQGNQANSTAFGGDVTGAPQSLQVNGLQGRRMSTSIPTDGQVLRWNASALDWEPSAGAQNTSTGGDLLGVLTNATVTHLQNKLVSAVTPADGQVLTWSQSGGQWIPLASAAGSGTGISTQNAAASGLAVSFVSSNAINIGAGCSVLLPCNVRFGTNVIAITSSSTVTWKAGAGTAFLYVTGTGTVTVGSNLTLVCSAGCTVAPGAPGFPIGTLPLYTWNAVLNGWDPAGGNDARAYLATKVLSAGTGVILVESAQQSTVALDTTLIPTYTSGTATLSFGTVAPASCSADVTLAVSGAAIGDALAPGWPAALPLGINGLMRVIAANTVAVRLCNLSSSGAAVPSAQYRATVVRGL